MNSPQHNCIRCAAMGAILTLAAMSIAVISVRADSGYPAQSSEGGSGWLEPTNEHYPEHGYILQRSDGTQEDVDIDTRRDYFPQRLRFEAPHQKYMRKWGLED